MHEQVPAIELDRVDLGYDGRTVLTGISGRFAPGSLTAVIGRNGSGKSTLVKAVAGLLAPLAGRIAFIGGRRRDVVGYLPQQSDLRREFPITVYDVVGLGLWRQTGTWRATGPVERSAIARALDAVRLTDLADRQIGALSGGQFQRALFARLVVQDAEIILLDEPFTAIDQKTTSDLLDIVAGWHADGRTVIAALHNVEMVEALFPQVVVVDARHVRWGDTATVLADYDPAHLGHGIDDATKRRFTRQVAGAA